MFERCFSVICFECLICLRDVLVWLRCLRDVLVVEVFERCFSG